MFDLQLFGDNDTLVYTNTLTIGLLRTDKKTVQKYNIPNPKSNLTTETVRSVANQMLTGYFVDSKSGEVLNTSTSVADTAYITQQSIRTLDLS